MPVIECAQEVALGSVVDYVLDEFDLQSGLQTRGLRLRYEIHGSLNADRSNVVLFPTWFAGRHPNNRWIIGSGNALDTDNLCVIVINSFCNGESSSPSNDTQLLMDDGRPVPISLYDNVRAQHRLVRSLGVETLHAVIGRSMGAQQALLWGCLYPEMVDRIFAFCGTPRTNPHNRLLLGSMADILERVGDDAANLQLAAKIYAGWSFSHDFFDERVSNNSHEGPCSWAEGVVASTFHSFDRRDLLSLIRTWQNADISGNPVFGRDLHRALRSIRARTLLMPISHDLLFPPQDFDVAQLCIHSCESYLLHSIWGHRAGAPGSAEADIAALEATIRRFLSTEPATTWDALSMFLGRLWTM